MQLFSTKQAADYLDLSRSAVRYHVDGGNLKPMKVGNSLVFTREQLDAFKLTKKGRGRPKKQGGND